MKTGQSVLMSLTKSEMDKQA